MLNKNEMNQLIDIMKKWEGEIKEFAGNRLSTKYKYLLDEMPMIISWLETKTQD